MSTLSKPREAALKALVSCEKDGAYLNIVLRDILSSMSMESRDNALATVLSFGVMKNRLYIDNIIENLSTVKIKKLSVWIHNILRIGIYSIKFLDRIPVSATVNECVRLSRRYGHSASAGFVNAILRKCAATGDFLPKDKKSDEYISIKYSMPMWLVKMWREQGYEEDFFAAMNEEPPVTVRLNTIKVSMLSPEYVKTDASPYSYNYMGGGSVENTELFKNGSIAVQDGASQKAVMALDIKEGMKVLDLCSAPGGKTAFIAQLLKNTGSVTSCDIHAHKIELIQNNLNRLGITNTTVCQNDATIIRDDFKDCFDRVLADVPCSGLGVLRRKPDIKWSKELPDGISLAKIQRSILENAALYVKKGGKLVYSTCTVNKTENEDNTQWFLENHSNFKLIEEKQLLPHKDKTDGFFYALFERK
ncbi:MAG: 16S rRNA (cytosine(967)-C(5))-methyltransferase RsmB [Clostridia bacterium]|nr:16S rRNA (cytosine(967)-C(5))-methyltransferase RsmB [Clostridia bacterium]